MKRKKQSKGILHKILGIAMGKKIPTKTPTKKIINKKYKVKS